MRVLEADVLLRGPAMFERPWKTLWAPFLCERTENPLIVDVWQEPWGFPIRSPGRDINAIDAWRALIETRNDAIRLGLESLDGVMDLHAAVVVHDEQALLLLGDAWAGKTTIALELIEMGWRYFSDDLAVIDIEGGRVRPVPKPPGVKAHAWEKMRRYWDPEPVELGPPEASFVIPAPFTGPLDDRAMPAWFVFLEYEDGAEAQIRAISTGEGVAQAGEHLGRVDGESFKGLAEVGQRCDHLRLTYGSAAQAAEQIRNTVLVQGR